MLQGQLTVVPFNIVVLRIRTKMGNITKPLGVWTFFSVFMVYPENMLTFAAERN